MIKQDLKVKIIPAQDAVKDIKHLILKAFNLTSTNKTLSYKGVDLKIQDLMVCSNTIKEEIKGWNEEQEGDLLEKILLGLFQLGYQNGALKVANEYEAKINKHIEKNEDCLNRGVSTEKGIESARIENEILMDISIDDVRHMKYLDKRLSMIDPKGFPEHINFSE